MAIDQWVFIFLHFEKNFKSMFNLLCKKHVIIGASNVRVFGSPPGFSLNASLIVRLISSNSEILSDQRKSFTVSYLINSCGLSPEAANVASKIVTLKSPEKTDLLLTLLRSHGLTDADITKLVRRDPGILVSHPEKTILPKLEFFHSIGMPPHVLAYVTSRTPRILRCSLENCIIPFYDYLKNLLQSDEKVITVFKRAPTRFLQIGLRQLPPNVAILKKYGVKESNISSLTVYHPESLMMRSDELVMIVNRVIELGIDVSKLIFVQAIDVLHCTSKAAWEARKRAYHKWGWSESDINMAFSIHPLCMRVSEKRIMSTMEFCVNEMNCEAKAIARRPTVLMYSLEKRIRPRCRAVKLLMVKGLIEGPYNLLTLLTMTDKTFLERFVTKYVNVPGLLDVYHGKLSLQDLGIDSSELAKVKLV